MQDGLGAIHWAAIKGHKEVIKYMVSALCRINSA